MIPTEKMHVVDVTINQTVAGCIGKKVTPQLSSILADEVYKRLLGEIGEGLMIRVMVRENSKNPLLPLVMIHVDSS